MFQTFFCFCCLLITIYFGDLWFKIAHVIELLIPFIPNSDSVGVLPLLRRASVYFRSVYSNCQLTKLAFPFSIKMQLFLRAQNTHTLEVTGQETVGEIKVNPDSFIVLSYSSLN